MIRFLILALLASPAFALERIDGRCYDTREIPGAAPKTQSKVKRPSIAASAPKPPASAASAPKAKPKPRIVRFEVDCPPIPKSETPFDFPPMPPVALMPPPAEPSAPSLPEVPVALLAPPELSCECFSPVAFPAFGGGGYGGGFIIAQVPQDVTVTPIPEPATWLLLLPAIAIIARRRHV